MAAANNQTVPLPYHLSLEALFDANAAYASEKAFLQSENSTNTTEYQISLFQTGFIALHRENHLDELLSLSQATLLPLPQNPEPPFTLTLKLEIISKKLIFETFKELKKFYELTLEVINNISKQTMFYEELFPSFSTAEKSYTFSVPFEVNLPAYFTQIPPLIEAGLKFKDDDVAQSMIDRIVGGHIIEYEKIDKFQIWKEFSGRTEKTKTNEGYERTKALEFIEDSKIAAQKEEEYMFCGSGLIGKFDAEILTARAVFEVPKTQKFVQLFECSICDFNHLVLKSCDIFVFESEICLEGVTENGAIQRLIVAISKIDDATIKNGTLVINGNICFTFNNVVDQSTFLYTIKDEQCILNSKNLISIEVPQQFDANSCSCQCFPSVLMEPSPCVKIMCWLSGYVELLGTEKSESAEVVLENMVNSQQLLEYIYSIQSKQMIPLELEEINKEFAVPISTEIGISTRSLSKLPVVETKVIGDNIYFAVFIDKWLLLYHNHADLLPKYAYYFDNCYSIIGEEISHQDNTIIICNYYGSDLILKLLPRIAYNSNNFAEALKDNEVGEMSIYNWNLHINERLGTQFDENLEEMFFMSHSLCKNANIKQLCEVVSPLEDEQLLFIIGCSIVDEISAFKSYECTLFFMADIFYILYKQDQKQVTRKLKYEDIEDIKELKQNAIEIIVQDESYVFKFKQLEHDEFIKVMVDLWQSSEGLNPTSLQESNPSYAGIHNNEKSGYVYVREDNAWNLYYLTLINKELYFFKDPLDTQPQFHFMLTGSICVNFDEQIMNQITLSSENSELSSFFDKDKGKYLVRSSSKSVAKFPTILSTTDVFDPFAGIPADYYSVISSKEFTVRDSRPTKVQNFESWTHNFLNELDIDTCIEELSIKTQLEKQKSGGQQMAQVEAQYLDGLNDISEYGNMSTVNFEEFVLEFEKEQQTEEQFGSVQQQLQSVIAKPVTDITASYLGSSFAVIHNKKMLIMSAVSSNDRDDWVSTINYYSPENLEEVTSCLIELSEVLSINELNVLQEEIQDYNIKLNDGILLFSPGKFLLTRTTIFDLVKREGFLLKNIREYKINKFATVKIINIDLKQLEIDFINLQNVKIFIDAAEIMRFAVIPSEFMHTNEYGFIDVLKLQSCLDYIGAPKLEDDEHEFYTTGLKPDKYIFENKPLDEEIMRLIHYMSNEQKLSLETLDSSNFDEVREQITSQLSQNFVLANKCGLNLNYLSYFEKEVLPQAFSKKYTRFVATKPIFAQYCFKIPSEFLREPSELHLELCYIVGFAQNILVFDSQYSDCPKQIISLKDCIAHESDALLSTFISDEQIENMEQESINTNKQVFDFGKAETHGGTLGREAKELIESANFEKQPLNFFKNTAGLYYLNSQTHFFAFAREEDCKFFISSCELQIPEMSSAQYDELKQLAIGTENEEFLLSVNTLFAEFQLGQDEILIKQAGFESLSPLEGEIPGGIVTDIEKVIEEQLLGDCYLTTHHICIRFVKDIKNQKGIKVSILVKNIIRISPSYTGVTVVYKHEGIEGRVEINGMENPYKFAKLATDLQDFEENKQCSSLLSNQPTAYAALYACNNIIMKTDCMLFFENRFINVEMSITGVKDRMTISGKPAELSMQLYQSLGDAEPMEFFLMKNIVVNLNKEQFLEDVIKEVTKIEKYLLLFECRHGKVVYAILLFENEEICQNWVQIIKSSCGDIQKGKIDTIREFSGTGERLAIQSEVQETFSQYELEFPDKELFLSKYEAILSAKIAGGPVVEDFTQKITDTAQLELQKKLINQQESHIDMFALNQAENLAQFKLAEPQIFLEPPSLTTSPIGQLYLLSDCIGFASEREIEIIQYKQITAISTATTIFNFETQTVEETAQSFPELHKMPNTLIISCRRPKNVCSYEKGQTQMIQQDTLGTQNISDSEGDEQLQKENSYDYEEVTLQFVLTPQEMQQDESLISALASASLQKVKIAQNQVPKSDFSNNVDLFDIGRKQEEVTLNTLKILFQVQDLAYEKRSLVPPSIFTNSPSLLSLTNADLIQQASILSNDLAQGWISCFIFVKFDLLFVIEAKQNLFIDQLVGFDFTLYAPHCAPFFQVVKIVDLRRASVMDGRFLTSVDSTISVVGSKLNEFNIRLFEDDFEQYLQNPLYVECPVGEPAGNVFVSSQYKMNFEQYEKFCSQKLQTVYQTQVQVDLNYLEPFSELERSIEVLAEKTELEISNLAFQQEKKIEIEEFEPDSLIILKFEDEVAAQEFEVTCAKIPEKYPASSNIKEQMKKLQTASEQLESGEDWQALKLESQPVGIFRTSLKTEKVSIPGKLMIGRCHFLFVGQVLGSRIYCVRRLSGFTAPPEFNSNEVIIRGGLLDEGEFQFEFDFQKSMIKELNEAYDEEIQRLVDQAKRAESYINQQKLNFNNEPTIVFESSSQEFKQILLDLTQISLNLKPASLKQSSPSAAACWPRLAFEPIYIYQDRQKQYCRFYVCVFGLRVYIFQSSQAKQPICSFPLLDIESERVFVDSELFEVPAGKIIKTLKQERGDEIADEYSDVEEKNGNISHYTIFAKLIVKDARQVLKIKTESNDELDQLVDSQFSFADDEIADDDDADNRGKAELFLAADETGILQKIKFAIDTGRQAALLFHRSLNERKVKIIQDCEMGTVSKEYPCKNDELGKCKIGICELQKQCLTKGQRGAVCGAAVFFKKSKATTVIQYGQIVDCYIVQLKYGGKQRIQIVYKDAGGNQLSSNCQVECDVQACKQLVKEICALIWWEQIHFRK